jgi:hypothetical protein
VCVCLAPRQAPPDSPPAEALPAAAPVRVEARGSRGNTIAPTPRLLPLGRHVPVRQAHRRGPERSPRSRKIARLSSNRARAPLRSP